MDVCNNILYFIYILLATIAVSCVLISMFKKKYNNSCNRWSLYIYYGIILYHCIFGEKYSGIVISSFILFISFYVAYVLNRKEINLVAICRYIRSISIPLLIISICCLGAKLIIYKFNDNSWWLNEENISGEISDWGDFSTCMTAFFALISIFYAYKAFRTMEKSFGIANDTLKSQILAAKRASFDATFTQIFAQHKVLYDKAVNHKIYISFWNKFIYDITNRSRNVFTACREEYEIKQNSMSVKKFWKYFNNKIELEASIDFKNYFKYIYHEVSIVIRQSDDILDGDTKLKYIQLIQAQMNYDELFCYLMNQIEYISRYKKKLDENKDELKNDMYQKFFDEAKWYANKLREYKFFKELCKNGCGYNQYISILMRKEEEIIKELIFADWVYIDENDCCN